MNNDYNVCEFVVSYKTKVKKSGLPQIGGSCDASKYLRPMFDEYMNSQEAFGCLFLNKANKIVGGKILFLGGVDSTIADPKIIFRTALLVNAVSVIICHNHPSGNLTPSEADKELTRKLISGGKFLGIQILDHIILSEESYFSFLDNGIAGL